MSPHHPQAIITYKTLGACLDAFGMANGKWQKFWWQKFGIAKLLVWSLDAY
jgi:hypothetical protein